MQQKGFRPENPFYGEIQITSIPSGLRATVTARALNEQFAFEAVVLNFYTEIGNYQAKSCQTLMKTSRSIKCGIR
jgi:hypothetical protein